MPIQGYITSIIVLLLFILIFWILLLFRRLKHFKSKNKQLEAQIKDMNDVITIVSHDLKGPFNRIYALINLLELSGYPSKSTQKEYINKMTQVVKEGINLVKNILDINKIETGDTSLNLKEATLNKVISDLTDSYNDVAKYKNVTINVQADAEIRIMTDPIYLERILENLLSNALKFSPADSEVDIIISNNSEACTISIRDYGESIPEEEISHIFEKYKTLSTKPTMGENSSGLGLTIVKLLCDLLGYEVRYSRVNTSGSEFQVIMPYGRK